MNGIGREQDGLFTFHPFRTIFSLNSASILSPKSTSTMGFGRE
ncbi:hypothetical protein V6Z11_A05G419500 [Gossypium hirsutum]